MTYKKIILQEEISETPISHTIDFVIDSSITKIISCRVTLSFENQEPKTQMLLLWDETQYHPAFGAFLDCSGNDILRND